MTFLTHAQPANDRLKRRFDEILGASLIAAVAVHFLLIQTWPEMAATIPDVGRPGESEIIDFVDVDLPPAPPPILRPAPPIAVAGAPPEATIEPMDWEGAAKLPPPPPAPDDDASERGRSGFEVYDVAPRLTNPAELQRALERAYPTSLRDARIGGTVTLQIFIDEEGRALEGRIVGPSSHSSFDRAALGLLDVMRFSPALNRDRRVPVWVEIPIAFRIRDGAG